MAATAGRQSGRGAVVVDESHLGQKPKLGGVRISHRHLFISFTQLLYVGVFVIPLYIHEFAFCILLFFSVCSVAFVALFVYYLKTQKDFLFVFFLSYNKKRPNIFLFSFLFGHFLLRFKLVPSQIKNNKNISLLAFVFSLIII